MSTTFQAVPWYDVQEWETVYNKIFSSTSTFPMKLSALESLLIWKARCPFLPSGIESTLCLLEMHILDLNRRNIESSEHFLSLAMSAALMRFVNHMLDSETAKGRTFYQAAKNSGIPEWIIDLRHDLAHSSKLPTVELLSEATFLALKWLNKNYWTEHKKYIANLVMGKLRDGKDVENRVAALLNFCISLGICSHSKCNIKNILEITDDNMRESLLSDAKDLFENIDLSNLKIVSINQLTETMYSKSRKLLNDDMVPQCIGKILLSEDSLFLSLELHILLDSYNFDCSKPLCKQYVECFEILLDFLHTNDLLLDLVLRLIEYTQSDLKNVRKRKLAAQWLATIFKALKKNKLFMQKLYETEIQDWTSKDKKEIYSLFFHWFPSYKTTFILDLRKSVPKNLTSMTFIKPIISTYNPCLTYFVNYLLHLIQPPLPETTITKICNLAKAVAAPERNITVSKIYTVDDVQVTHKDSEDEVMEVFAPIPEIKSAETPDIPSGIWEMASSDHDWYKYPLGRLPWQKIQTVEDMEM